MKKLRIGLLGFGDWTRTAYLPALERDSRAQVRSVAAPSQRTRKLARSQLGSGVEVFADQDGLFHGPELDAVMVAVSDAAHETCLSAALDSGLAVFYEPPLADDPARIPALQERLRTASQLTFADLELGFLPVVRRAAERVRKGAIGLAQALTIRLHSSWGPVTGSKLSNIAHLTPWYVDVMNRILGSTPARVLVLEGRGVSGRRQNHSIGHFDFGGTWGTLQANIASVGKLEAFVEVNGDDGDMVINLFSGELGLRTRQNPNWTIERLPSMQPHAGWPGMHESVGFFLDAVERGDDKGSNAGTVSSLHQVSLAAEASKDSGEWENV